MINKEELRLDYLKNHPELKLYQSKKMFRIGTDTCLLGEFFHCNANDTVLDIGTNNGALLIYAHLQTNNKITGIDINLEALEIAKMNMELHNVKEYEFIGDDFLKHHFDHPFDAVICNPPFFLTKDEKCKNKDMLIRNARHEDSLPLPDLIAGVNKILKEDGSFFFAYRYDRMEEIIKELPKNNFFIQRMVIVKDLRNNRFGAVMLHVKHTKVEYKEEILEITGY